MRSGLRLDRGPTQGERTQDGILSGQWVSGCGVLVPFVGGTCGPDCLLLPKKPADLVTFSFISFIL